MNLSLIEKSKYFRGLLVLLRRDRIIDPRERELLLKLGSVLDFDRRFCEATIDELMSNPHISRDPIVFDEEQTKESFFRDAVQLAMADESIHPSELRWLRTVAHANHKSDEWLNSVIGEIAAARNSGNDPDRFEIQRYL